ncbi:MAG: hypothetical protein JW725_04380 [Candidatus Babeliaceae bacterium]|nr:hypothetical protein [Candidatus Babeliaceae bacterium]
MPEIKKVTLFVSLFFVPCFIAGMEKGKFRKGVLCGLAPELCTLGVARNRGDKLHEDLLVDKEGSPERCKKLLESKSPLLISWVLRRCGEVSLPVHLFTVKKESKDLEWNWREPSRIKRLSIGSIVDQKILWFDYPYALMERKGMVYLRDFRSHEGDILVMSGYQRSAYNPAEYFAVWLPHKKRFVACYAHKDDCVRGAIIDFGEHLKRTRKINLRGKDFKHSRYCINKEGTVLYILTNEALIIVKLDECQNKIEGQGIVLSNHLGNESFFTGRKIFTVSDGRIVVISAESNKKEKVVFISQSGAVQEDKRLIFDSIFDLQVSPNGRVVAVIARVGLQYSLCLFDTEKNSFYKGVIKGNDVSGALAFNKRGTKLAFLTYGNEPTYSSPGLLSFRDRVFSLVIKEVNLEDGLNNVVIRDVNVFHWPVLALSWGDSDTIFAVC